MTATTRKKPFEATDTVSGPAQRAPIQIKAINEFANLMIELTHLLRVRKIRGFSPLQKASHRHVVFSKCLGGHRSKFSVYLCDRAGPAPSKTRHYVTPSGLYVRLPASEKFQADTVHNGNTYKSAANDTPRIRLKSRFSSLLLDRPLDSTHEHTRLSKTCKIRWQCKEEAETKERK